ncbi:Uncharacterised protein [Chromobacterium violaceum]|uniref:Uncharacterized protein n=1 Tax=Chromobacterium violaceum TaxID=536 RepID=A0A447TL55_CHRVL|nr:Uncharacterised protein [Chromobacterium violaceum]
MTPIVFPRRWLPLLSLPLLAACAGVQPPPAPIRYCPAATRC